MHSIITPQEMYLAEQEVIAGGVPGFELMLRAGRAIGEILHAAYPDGDISVLCGPGGNSGDGFVAAARLIELGRSVSVYAMTPVEQLKGDPRQAAALWTGPVNDLHEAKTGAAGIVLDALFGGGLSRPLSGIASALPDELEGTVIAVDVPSGLDGASARPLGSCFRAALTITFAALRPAHVLHPGRDLCGEIHVVDIGVPTPGHTRTVSSLSFDKEETVLVRDDRRLEELRPEGKAPINRIEAVRGLSRQMTKPVVLDTPDRILAEPTGQVFVEIEH